jgi:hypothetical protein
MLLPSAHSWLICKLYVIYCGTYYFFRFGLCDILRFGDRVVISPNKNLSIVSDSLGRVILIDNLKGLAIRMWKGVWYCSISFL